MERFLGDVQRFVRVDGKSVNVDGPPADDRRHRPQRRPQRLPERRGERRAPPRTCVPADDSTSTAGDRRRSDRPPRARGSSSGSGVQPPPAGDRIGGDPMSAIRGRPARPRREAAVAGRRAAGRRARRRPDRARPQRPRSETPAAGDQPSSADAGKRRRRPPSRSTDAATGEDERPGSVRNPFKQLHVAQGAASPRRTRRPRPAAADQPTGSGAGGSDGSQPPLAPGGTGGTAAPATAAQAQADAGDPLDVYHLSLRFGRAEAAQLKTYHDVARLTPLPSADNPFFVFLGVAQGRQDRGLPALLRRRPRPATALQAERQDDCQTIELKEGDTEFFDLTVDGEAVPVPARRRQGHQEGRRPARPPPRPPTRATPTPAPTCCARPDRVGSSAFKGAATYRWLPDQRRARPHAPSRAGARLGQRRRRRLARRRHGRAARPAGLGAGSPPAPSGRDHP